MGIYAYCFSADGFEKFAKAIIRNKSSSVVGRYIAYSVSTRFGWEWKVAGSVTYCRLHNSVNTAIFFSDA